MLDNLIKNKVEVIIYTVNGYQMRGVILKHDSDSVLVYSDGREKMVYKHAISTIGPV